MKWIFLQEDPTTWTTISHLAEEYGDIDLLKIDIEGYEYDVVASWTSDMNLPFQVAMEIHSTDLYYGTTDFRNSSSNNTLIWPPHQMSLSDITLFMLHISNLGYTIVSKEDNYACPHCSEFTFQRLS